MTNTEKLYYDGWKVSLKYSTILTHFKTLDLVFDNYENIYHQYLSELKFKNLTSTKNTQVWETFVNSMRKNKYGLMPLKILHQTNIQRVNYNQ